MPRVLRPQLWLSQWLLYLRRNSLPTWQAQLEDWPREKGGPCRYRQWGREAHFPPTQGKSWALFLPAEKGKGAVVRDLGLSTGRGPQPHGQNNDNINLLLEQERQGLLATGCGRPQGVTTANSSPPLQLKAEFGA